MDNLLVGYIFYKSFTMAAHGSLSVCLWREAGESWEAGKPTLIDPVHKGCPHELLELNVFVSAGVP